MYGYVDQDAPTPSMPEHLKAPSTQHPMYKIVPVIPGDHAYNIAEAALGLVINMEPQAMRDLADGKLTDKHVSIKTADLKTLFDVISAETRLDVLHRVADMRQTDPRP